jgi:hypothetical protein
MTRRLDGQPTRELAGGAKMQVLAFLGKTDAPQRSLAVMQICAPLVQVTVPRLF